MDQMKRLWYVLTHFGFSFFVLNILDHINNLLKMDNEFQHFIHSIRYKKIETFLLNNNKELIEKYKNKSVVTTSNNEKKVIWVMWWQGIQNAPKIVKICVNSILNNNPNKKVIILDENNYSKYVDIPQNILTKVYSGKLSITNLSDLIRLKVLSKYGGMWFDSTIYLNKPINDLFDKYPFFSIKTDHKKWSVSKGLWTTFLMGCDKNNILFAFSDEVMTNYLQKYDYIIGYFLIDAIISLAYNNIPLCRIEIDKVPENNNEIYDFQKQINKRYVGNIPTVSKMSARASYIEQDDENLTNYGYIKRKQKN